MAAANATGNVTLGGVSPYANTTSPLAAVQNHTLGVGFSGSGFLILYFTGVTAILQSLGIINNSTRLAGSSGGAITAAAICSNVPASSQQLAANFNIAATCRPSFACRGYLDKVVRNYTTELFPASVTEQCNRRLYVTVTEARPNNLTDPPQVVGNISSKGMLLDAVAASAYLPFWSGRSAVTTIDGLPAVYDGGFSYPLPCPPGVTYCVKVTANAGVAPSNSIGPRPRLAGDNTLQLLMTARNASDSSSARFLPLNPAALPAPANPDIYPGLSGPLNVSAAVWNSYGLVIPDNDTLLSIYNQGRKDAAAWVLQHGLAQPAAVQQALQSTEGPLVPGAKAAVAGASVGRRSSVL
uniref:Patatin n=1 Tax=Tetradesmus obliquus TaxID=3088 RepID=A0A383WI03_TETOB|eukprot:jgi/Sobl393_1/17389/SZX76842.1